MPVFQFFKHPSRGSCFSSTIKLYVLSYLWLSIIWRCIATFSKLKTILKIKLCDFHSVLFSWIFNSLNDPFLFRKVKVSWFLSFDSNILNLSRFEILQAKVAVLFVKKWMRQNAAQNGYLRLFCIIYCVVFRIHMRLIILQSSTILTEIIRVSVTLGASD